MDLTKLSIEELGNIQVTSVSKHAESANVAPSSIYVITREDILRSGATALPEMLRLAPNLQVAQTSASHYVITARGFSGNSQAQSFSNKLLVLIDGRTVYSPLFSGVYWDMQDVVPADVDRIEVVSGPGATLWGANAVNGVINIITRGSGETRGGILEVSGGDLERNATARYGMQLGPDVNARVYAKGMHDDATVTDSGAQANDTWSKLQGGFRLDWTPRTSHLFTLQGDAHSGQESQTGAADEHISGENLLARWNHEVNDHSAWQVQTYYDRAARSTEQGGGSFTVETYDVAVQHNWASQAHEVVWGAGYRRSHYFIEGTTTLFFVPPGGNLDLINFFVQDGMALNKQLKLTVGLKIENDPYIDPALLPSVRLAWTPNDTTSTWAAISRAIRAPTPFDRDVVEKLGDITYVVAGDDFRAEKLWAYEVGTRIRPAASVSVSAAAFYNTYDDLRSIEFSAGTLPLRWGNGMQGHSYGFETWAEFQARSWWRLSAALTTLRKHLEFKPDSSALLGTSQAGNDPEYQASLHSAMDIGQRVTLDAMLRYVSALPDPHVPAYLELNARLAWRISDSTQLALSGFNLLHPRHMEFAGDGVNAVPRSALAQVQWNF